MAEFDDIMEFLMKPLSIKIQIVSLAEEIKKENPNISTNKLCKEILVRLKEKQIGDKKK